MVEERVDRGEPIGVDDGEKEMSLVEFNKPICVQTELTLSTGIFGNWCLLPGFTRFPLRRLIPLVGGLVGFFGRAPDVSCRGIFS